MAEQSKSKYIISPENTYILDYGDMVAEVSGDEVLAQFRRESYLEHLIKQIDENNINNDTL